MDYYVKVTTEGTFTRDDGKRGHNEQSTYLPSFNRRDAEQTVSCLHSVSMQNHRHHGTTYHRTFQVVGSVWSGRGRVYLSLDTLEQIADEYTRGDDAPAMAAE